MKVGFIDNVWRMQTQSTQFLFDILTKNGITVEPAWNDSWLDVQEIDFSSLIDQYDALIFFQCGPDTDAPYKVAPNLTLIPMLDSFGNDRLFHWNASSWSRFLGTKILHFSKALYCATTSHGIAGKYAQYFPNPEQFSVKEANNELSGFFWQRTPKNINIDTIKILIGDTQFDKIHVHLATDPGYDFININDRDIARHNITTSEWFPNRNDLYDIMNENSVFFAPRTSEGIGMAFLEAMAMGKCVVAPNYGTMNEYIINGLNGLLYEHDNPQPLNYSRHKELGKMARVSIEEGYKEWTSMESELIDFIMSPNKAVYRKIYHSGYNYEEEQARNPHTQITEQQTLIKEQNDIISNQQTTINALMSSTSWKITKPLRCIFQALKRTLRFCLPYAIVRYYQIKKYNQ